MTDDRPSEHPGVAQLDRNTLMALVEASRIVNAGDASADVCRQVALQAAKVLDAAGASVLLHDPERNLLVFHAVADPEDSERVRGHGFPADQGIAGQVLRTRRPVNLADVAGNRNFYDGIDEMTGTTTGGMIAVPLIHHDAAIGVVEVVNPNGRSEFSAADLRLLEVFANLIAGTAHRASSLDEQTREVEGWRAARAEVAAIGHSDAFNRMVDLCMKVAPSDTTALLLGETGSGKEVAARLIHESSRRSNHPFIDLNCAALPDTLVESELFGHEAGAFTGASTRRAGRFELAHRGTLFLDEIGELPLPAQATLLRVLETGTLTRVGGHDAVTCDVRVIAATNRDLRNEISAGRFREDLFYRLNAFPIEIPSLRERRSDLRLLAEHLLAQGLANFPHRRMPTIAPDALSAMERYDWPGNIRELRNVIDRALLLADDDITLDSLPPEVRDGRRDQLGNRTVEDSRESRSMTDDIAAKERTMIRQALEDNDWNQSAAARSLGITRDMLRYRVRRYGLQRS